MKVLIILFAYLISQIYCCITFDSGDNSKCEYDTSAGLSVYPLDCSIEKPKLNINETNCTTAISSLTIRTKSIEDLEEFYVQSVTIVNKLFGLFPKNNTETCDINIIISPIEITNATNYLFDPTRILVFLPNVAVCRPILKIEMSSKNWKKINLTINQDVNNMDRPQKLIWKLSDGSKKCELAIEKGKSQIETAEENCRSYFKIVDNS